MRKLLAVSLLLVPAPSLAQVHPTVYAGDSVVACRNVPRPSTTPRCQPVPKGTLIHVIGSLSDEWVRVGIGDDLLFVRSHHVAPKPSSPCADSLYIAIKQRELATLSDREYQYLLERDRACTEFQRAVLMTEPQRAAVEQTRNLTRSMNDIVAVSAILTAAGFLLWFMIDKY